MSAAAPEFFIADRPLKVDAGGTAAAGNSGVKPEESRSLLRRAGRIGGSLICHKGNRSTHIGIAEVGKSGARGH